MTQTQAHAHKKASSKQVAMLFAIARSSGLTNEMKILEYLEFDSGLGLELDSLDDLPATLVDQVKYRLENRNK